MSEPSAESIWARPERGERGPRGDLSRTRIARAAVELADSGGLEAVTMRAVAERLGTSAAGLYRYVRSRDELIALMVDQAIGELRLAPTEGTWRERILAVAIEQRDLYAMHPWLMTAEAGPGAGSMGPQALRYFDRCLAILAEVPASPTTKMEALAMLTGVVTLFARPVAAESADPRALFAALDPQEHPTLTAALAEPSPPAPAQPDLFARTIDSLLTGLLDPDTAR